MNIIDHRENMVLFVLSRSFVLIEVNVLEIVVLLKDLGYNIINSKHS